MSSELDRPKQVRGLTELSERARTLWSMIDEPVSRLSEASFERGTHRDRYKAWARALPAELKGPPEYLLPRIVRSVTRADPGFNSRHCGPLDKDLESIVNALGPWGIPFPLGDGRATRPSDERAKLAYSRVLFRRDLINGTVADLLGDDLAAATALDIGCNMGFFSLDLAQRGVSRVDGIDLRPENVARACFLAEHYELHNAHFRVADAEFLELQGQWDIVLNLGLLYHLTDPLTVLRHTFEKCRLVAVIDTVCGFEPVSGFIIKSGKDVTRPSEGREAVEFKPTYRGLIDLLYYVGFRDIFEVVGEADPPFHRYRKGRRRCFLAFP